MINKEKGNCEVIAKYCTIIVNIIHVSQWYHRVFTIKIALNGIFFLVEMVFLLLLM